MASLAIFIIKNQDGAKRLCQFPRSLIRPSRELFAKTYLVLFDIVGKARKPGRGDDSFLRTPSLVETARDSLSASCPRFWLVIRQCSLSSAAWIRTRRSTCSLVQF